MGTANMNIDRTRAIFGDGINFAAFFTFHLPFLLHSQGATPEAYTGIPQSPFGFSQLLRFRAHT